MTTMIIFIILGLALLAKQQVETMVYWYKRTGIYAKTNSLNGNQTCAMTKLDSEYKGRPTIIIPKLNIQVKLPVISEIIGSLILIGTVIFSFYAAIDTFTFIFPVAIGGATWIYVTKIVLIHLLKSSNSPSIKLVIMAILAYPALCIIFILMLRLMLYFKIVDLPYYLSEF